MKKLLRNDAFQYLSLSVLLTLGIYAIDAAKGLIVAETVYVTFLQVLDIIIAVSIFIGLFQVWVKPPTIVKWLGKGSGWKGFALVCTFPILMGGSLFTVFPLLKTLRDKGARQGAIASFITAWGGKAPLLPLETKFLGWPFALVRLAFVVLFAFLMGLLMDWIYDKSRPSIEEKGA
ncbi:MAG: hypothetical protein C4576_10860 [Desulfobacteraceae bacterium]|nr:MAG: hypothetical protein C4576_10860 [Desulfobacteraceae bacterium]